jgi:hypothetical protein
MALIGICGRKNTGKTTAAKYLCNKLSNTVEVSFSDPIKDICGIVFGWNKEQLNSTSNKDWKEQVDKSASLIHGQPIVPRKVMQLIGTDMFRKQFSEDCWINIARERVRSLREQGFNVIISDVRFQNEADMIKSSNGIIIKLLNNSILVDEHISEITSDSIVADYEISNLYNSTFFSKLDEVVSGMPTKASSDSNIAASGLFYYMLM